MIRKALGEVTLGSLPASKRPGPALLCKVSCLHLVLDTPNIPQCLKTENRSRLRSQSDHDSGHISTVPVSV